MIRPLSLQYVGFRSTADSREYTLRVRGPEEPRQFTISIPHTAFAAHRARYQDAPDICFHKLTRELAANAELGAGHRLAVSDAELAEYRESQTKKGPERRARAPKVPR